jgi:threonine dehydratase
MLATASEITWAEPHVYAALDPTPQISWPLIDRRAGCEVWIKHENHLPTGSFKVRGGLSFAAAHPDARALIAATRGNHGQSVAYAARRLAATATIVVPRGNSPEKNDAMRGYGARLVEHGRDFDEALVHARSLAARPGSVFVPSLDPLLVRGVATAARELFRAVDPLDALYVPIGLGSGILGAISARESLGLRTEIIGVVATRADAYALSLERGAPTETASADTIADGLAVRVPHPDALDAMQRHVARIVRVDDDAIRDAIRHILLDIHQLAEGAGAAPLAALLAERDAMRGKRVGLMLTGGNLDTSVLAGLLPPSPRRVA